MPDQPLRPATAQELTESLAFALRYDGRKRVYTGHDFMARITAERLVEHLTRSGFVLMKKPPATAPSRIQPAAVGLSDGAGHSPRRPSIAPRAPSLR